MKKLILDHSYTPPSLKEINQDLLEVLLTDDPDESEFLRLVTIRDEFIQTYLIDLEVEPKEKFSKAEIDVNGALVACANELFKASLSHLSGLLRGRKAVQKYK